MLRTTKSLARAENVVGTARPSRNSDTGPKNQLQQILVCARYVTAAVQGAVHESVSDGARRIDHYTIVAYGQPKHGKYAVTEKYNKPRPSPTTNLRIRCLFAYDYPGDKYRP